MQRTRSYKQAQKESQYLREVSELFRQAAMDHADLKDMYPNRVSLSADVGICTVYFYSPLGKAYFESKLKSLVLFKPSLRNAIAKKISQRRVPDFRFIWDETAEKQQRIEEIFHKIKLAEPQEPSDDDSSESEE
jgi:ribosome-binding factor A